MAYQIQLLDLLLKAKHTHTNHNLCQEIQMLKYDNRLTNYRISVDVAHILEAKGVNTSYYSKEYLNTGDNPTNGVLVYSPEQNYIWLVNDSDAIPISEDMQASLALMPNHEARLALLTI